MLCAQWTCHVFSGLAYFVSPLSVSRATGSCTRTFPFLSYAFPFTWHLYYYGWTTRHRTLVCFPFPLLSWWLVYLRSSLMPFSFCLVDSSPVSLFLDSDSLPSHSPFLYVCTCISHTVYIYGLEMGLLPIFNLLCNHPKGVTCKIPRTLLVLSSSLAKAIRFATLREFPSVLLLTGSEVQPTQCTSVCS